MDVHRPDVGLCSFLVPVQLSGEGALWSAI
jgi:hypothetical protein